MRNILRQVFFFEAQGCDQSKNLLNNHHSRKYEMSDRKSAESTVGPVLSDVCHVKNDNCPFIKYLGGPNYNWEMRVFKYKPLFGFLIFFAQSPFVSHPDYLPNQAGFPYQCRSSGINNRLKICR